MKIFIHIGLIFLLISGHAFAQEHPDFKIIKEVKTSSVKDQASSGTCWSYATTSFFETEAIRKGLEEIDLSEIYFVRYAYIQKAIYYVRLHGLGNFSQGGQGHDVTNVIKEYGAVPEKVYQGLEYGEPYNKHSEMVSVLKGMLENVVKNKNKRLSTGWLKAFTAALDSYLGNVPEKFEYNSKEYTPKSFSKDYLKLDMNDYVELTSYSHHPFYEWIDLEIPDNWSHDRYLNVPIDELMDIIKTSFDKGYSVCWDGDVSEKGFQHRKGKATLSNDDIKCMNNKGVQEFRQLTFDNYTTTDDHLMHLTAYAKDDDGKIYYQTKNSWASDSNDYGGYLYMSEDFVKIKTVAILVHKDVLPQKIKNYIK